ncbi:uncharacterized protein N7469_005381 [Penicillium citrinum]|uniref:Uncharacterized protein n=1 Tax=Penicillium citrinum TaxID=5077 RepID=A0A9W9P1J4_PENCI|nr:uncharacterized protein N7469_005381 [Penicillium citrinum]KAJ5233615.1 hypothetical protein N7469_005381 [Penicillium citrinum]
MTPPPSKNFTQPAECYYSRDNIPSLGAKYTTLVPLYQEDHHDKDMSQILDSCCREEIWFYEDPSPCTAVCSSRSDAQAQEVQYCLNSREVNYGRDGMDESSAVRNFTGRKIWALVLVGGLMLSGL